MNKNCPYCHSDRTGPFHRISEKIMEYLCKACSCTFNVKVP